MRLVSRSALNGGMAQAQQAPQAQMRQAPAYGHDVLAQLAARLDEAEKNISRLAQSNNALVQENSGLKKLIAGHHQALANYKAHFNGLVKAVKVSYAPDAQPAPARAAPTSPGAQTVDATATAAPVSPAQQVSNAADKLFYGNGDSAFYEGGENDS